MMGNYELKFASKNDKPKKRSSSEVSVTEPIYSEISNTIDLLCNQHPLVHTFD